jgi:N-acetylmuramoyl-L-alanine amidase
MKKKTWLVGLLLLACGYDSEQSLRIAQQNAEIAVKDPSLYDYFTLDSLGVSFFKSPKHRFQNRVECRLSWQEGYIFSLMSRGLPSELWHRAYQKDTFDFDKKALKAWQELPTLPGRTYSPERPLQGVRIAIDPGHLGGSMATAEMEARYIKAIVGKDTLQFNEGTLAWQTAKALENSLLQLGATVFITRRAPGYSSFGKTYSQWLAQDKNKAIEREVKEGRIEPANAKKLKLSKDSLFVFNQLFKRLELRQRAKIINEFRPDATLIIHYNADQDSWERRDPHGFYELMDFNYCMAFVGGAFMRSELDELKDRAEFARLIVSDDLPKSIKLSRLVVEKHEELLGIKPADESMGIRYLKAVCSPTGARGVYARNMALTRYIKGPICYGESFCQDELTQALALAKNDTIVAGIAMSKRITEVARAYHEALVAFFE